MVSPKKIIQSIIINNPPESKANRDAIKKLERDWRRQQNKLKKEKKKERRSW